MSEPMAIMAGGFIALLLFVGVVNIISEIFSKDRK